MPKIYSYILKSDAGAAPNPFWGTCTLTICKPAIRRAAHPGDWIIGTGSKHSECKDGYEQNLSGYLIYAMKVTDKVTMQEYDTYCRKYLQEKIPKWSSKNWKERLGDCIYDFSEGKRPRIRKSVHAEENMKRDLGGKNALLSNHYYYFGEKPILIPNRFQKIVTKRQGHLKLKDEKIVKRFERWISRYKKNKIYAFPKRRFVVDKTDTKKRTCKTLF